MICARTQAADKPGHVHAFRFIEHGRRHCRNAEQRDKGVDTGHGHFLGRTGIDGKRCCCRFGIQRGCAGLVHRRTGFRREATQRDRAEFEFGLLGDRIDRVARHRIDAQVLAKHIIPVHRCKAGPGAHAIGHDSGQYRAATARAHLDAIFGLNAQFSRIFRMNFNERPRIKLVEHRDLAGLGHRVPLMLQAAGIEHNGKFRHRHLRWIDVRAGKEHRFAMRCRKHQCRLAAVRRLPERLTDAIVQIAHGITVVLRIRCTRPLQWRVAQTCMACAAQIVASLRIRSTGDLRKNLFRRCIAERIGKTHFASHPCNDLPVGQGGARWVDGLLHERHVALGVDHHAFSFGPQRAGQQDIRIAIGLGVEKRILRDHEFGSLQTRDHVLPVGHARHGIRADDPARLDVTRRHAREHIHGALARFGSQRARRNAPQVLHKGTIFSHQHRTLAGQPWTHIAHFTATHCVGLARQRKRTATGAADLACREMQIADGVGVPRAVRALVQTHGPATHPFGRFADPLRSGTDRGFRQARNVRDFLWRVLCEKGRHRVPSFGVLFNESGIRMAVLKQ